MKSNSAKSQRNRLMVVAVLLMLAAGLAFRFVQAPSTAPAPSDASQASVRQTQIAAASATAAADEIRRNAVGRWQSDDDGKFVREIGADGRCRDWYDGDVNDWQPCGFVTGSEATPDIAPQPEVGAVYLYMGEPGPDRLSFLVLAVTAERLELSYVARGNTLKFMRLKP